MSDRARQVGVYCRISDDREGRELGVERQERLCRDLAAKSGDTVIEVYVDNDLSAWSARRARPDFARMLADAEAGRINVIIAYTLKRLTRRWDEGGALLDLAKDRGVRYEFVRASPVDLNTAAGRKQFRGMVNDAISESDESSERITDANSDLRAQGEPTTHLGHGYRRVDGKWTVDEVAARAMAQGAKDLLAGISLRAVARSWNATTFTNPKQPWTADIVRSTLSKPSVAGLLAHKGEIVGKGNWPAILDESTWRAVRVLLADPERRFSHSRTPVWVGAGIYRCGRCGDGTTMRSNANTAKLNNIYRCRQHNHLSIKSEPVDEFVRAAIAVVLDDGGTDLLVVDHGEDPGALQAALTDLRGQQADLGREFAARRLSMAAFTAADTDLSRQLAELERRLADVFAPRGSVLEGIADAPDPGAAFLAAVVERQRAVVDVLAVVTILPDAGNGRTAGAVDTDRIRIEPR
jgi:DNA invertase Pin-like site-specific DNA recombinase